MKKIYMWICGIIFSVSLNGQDLMMMLDSVSQVNTTKEFIQGTFKTVRLINGYTSEIAEKKDLVFSISHRFNPVNEGFYEFFGLDQSQIRFGFEYGLSDRIDIGIGRGNMSKLYDGFVKVKLFKQSKGTKSFPFTITLMEGMAVKTEKFTDPSRDYPWSSRLYYTHELFISRKFNQHFAAQVVPAIIHRNMVIHNEEQNIVPAIGLGANYTINKWLSVSGEYYYLIPGYTADHQSNSFALGVELESGGGHVFQIHLSNSHGMTDKSFVAETTGKWTEGDIQIGFNIIRVFHIKKKK